jgi:hypothetical protein
MLAAAKAINPVARTAMNRAIHTTFSPSMNPMLILPVKVVFDFVDELTHYTVPDSFGVVSVNKSVDSCQHY